METWVTHLQIPGLMLAAGVIVLLFKTLTKTIDFSTEMLKQRAEERVLLAEMATMLRQLCSIDRVASRDRDRG